MIRPSGQLAVFALIAGAALAGCSSTTSGSGAHSPSTTPSTSPASSTSSAASSSPAGPSQAAASSSKATGTQVTTPQCTNDIRVIPGTAQGAAGHIALVLVFNNISTTVTCEIFGYPGVDLVTPSGATVVHLARTLRGMAGGEPLGVTGPQAVILRPGASASALAEASDVPQGGITNCGNYSLLVTVPNQFVSVPAGTAMLPRCAAEIHPVVAGTTGGMG